MLPNPDHSGIIRQHALLRCHRGFHVPARVKKHHFDSLVKNIPAWIAQAVEPDGFRFTGLREAWRPERSDGDGGFERKLRSLSAELHSAVSRICNLLGLAGSGGFIRSNALRAAECNTASRVLAERSSAILQSATLRYGRVSALTRRRKMVYKQGSLPQFNSGLCYLGLEADL